MIEKAQINHQQISIKVHVNSVENCLSSSGQCRTHTLRGDVEVYPEFIRLHDPYGSSEPWSYEQIISIKPRKPLEKEIKKIKKRAKDVVLFPLLIVVMMVEGFNMQF